MIEDSLPTKCKVVWTPAGGNSVVTEQFPTSHSQPNMGSQSRERGRTEPRGVCRIGTRLRVAEPCIGEVFEAVNIRCAKNNPAAGSEVTQRAGKKFTGIGEMLD